MVGNLFVIVFILGLLLLMMLLGIGLFNFGYDVFE